MKKAETINKLVLISLFAALAYVCVAVFRIKISFLTLDLKDAIITIAAMLINPVAGIAISVVVSLIEMVTLSDTMLYGFLMNVISTVSFATVASVIYRAKKSLYSAILGLVCGVLSMTATMMLANLLITPYYMGVTVDEVVGLIPKLLLPFNLIKSVINACIVMIIYKPVSQTLKRAGMKTGDNAESYSFKGKSIVVTLAALAVAVICFVIIFKVLGAEIK